MARVSLKGLRRFFSRRRKEAFSVDELMARPDASFSLSANRPRQKESMVDWDGLLAFMAGLIQMNAITWVACKLITEGYITVGQFYGIFQVIPGVVLFITIAVLLVVIFLYIIQKRDSQ